MNTSTTCVCGTSLPVAEREPAVRCPNCGREFPPDAKDRWGAERDEAADRRRGKRRKLAFVGVPLVIVVSLAILAPLFWVVPQYVLEPAERIQSSDNLRKIALALHNYHDTKGRLPPAVVYDKEGRPLYSWRVLLLPWVTQRSNPLYGSFRLDEPWDSPHNKNCLAEMPEEYALPGKRNSPHDYVTHYQVIDGPTAAFDSGVRLRRDKPAPEGLVPFEVIPTGGRTIVVYESEHISRFPATFVDGTSNTILIAEADEPVPWTAPQDLDYIPGGPLPKLGGLRRSRVFMVAMGDGSSRPIDRRKISDTILRAALTASGREGAPPDHWGY